MAHSAVFTRLAITRPEVNRFGWNLQHSEYIVGGRPWQIFSAPCSTDSWILFFCQVNKGTISPRP